MNIHVYWLVLMCDWVYSSLFAGFHLFVPVWVDIYGLEDSIVYHLYVQVWKYSVGESYAICMYTFFVNSCFFLLVFVLVIWMDNVGIGVYMYSVD